MKNMNKFILSMTLFSMLSIVGSLAAMGSSSGVRKGGVQGRFDYNQGVRAIVLEGRASNGANVIIGKIVEGPRRGEYVTYWNKSSITPEQAYKDLESRFNSAPLDIEWMKAQYRTPELAEEAIAKYNAGR